MNIFLLLGFLLLSLSDASLTRSRTNKRQIEEENLSEDSVEVEVAFSKLRKLDPNAKVKIFKLPGEILAFIGTFLQNPFETLSPVSFDFRMAMKCFTPNYLLQSRTSFANFDQIPVSPELARLLKLDPVYLNSKAGHLFFPGSVFVPESPVTVAHTIHAIETQIVSKVDRLKATYKLVDHLINLKQFESVLVILRTVPGLGIQFTPSEFFTDFFVYIYKSKNFVDFHVLKNSCLKKLPFYFTLASLPVSLETFNELIKGETVNHEIFLSTFAASCTIILPFTLTEEEETLIRERNYSIIDSIKNVPEICVQFVSLCNELRYSACDPDITISNEFLTNLYEYATSGNFNFKAKIKFYCETLAVIALMRGYKNIFKQIVSSRKVSLNSAEFTKILLKSPDFIKLVSPSLFKKHLGIKNQVMLFEAGKLGKEEVHQIKNVYERIRVMSCFMEHEEFAREVQVLFATSEFSVSNLIEVVIEKSEEEKNLAKTVHLILQSFTGRRFTQHEISKLSLSLGNSKYLKSILKPENQEFLVLPSEQLYVLVNGKNFKEILKFASVLKQEKAKDFRERFLVKWLVVFREVRLFPHEIEKFFDIFGVNLGNFNYSNEYALSTDLILKDSRVLFREPETLGPFVDLMLIEVSERIFTEDSVFNYWHQLDKTNPFLLKIYGIYKLWSDRNLKSFLLNARKSLLVAFNSNVTEDFIDEIVFEDQVNEQLVSRTFINAIPANQQIEIKVKTLEELRIFFHENVPKIAGILNAKDNYEIVIDWESIIEGSRTVIDYEIILSVITYTELMELFTMQTKYDNFLNYVRATNQGRYYTQTNRHLVK